MPHNLKEDSNEKYLLFVSWHSTIPRNNGANVRITNILTNISHYKPLFISPEPKDELFDHVTFKTSDFLCFVRNVLPFNPEIFRCFGKKVEKRVSNLIGNYEIDGVLCEHLWSFPLSERLARRFGVPLILIEHVIEKLYALRTFNNNLLAKLIGIFEGKALRESDYIVAMSEFDKKFIVDNFKIDSNKIWIVPNGVNIPDEEVPTTDESAKKDLDLVKDYKVVLFLGKTSLLPNEQAISIIKSEIVSRIKRVNGKVLFMFVGGPAKKDYSNIDNGFVYTGFVPELYPYLKRADMCIAPLVGHTGMPIKVLEYASFKKPIVATSKAIEGAGFENDKEILIRDNWDDFAQAILELIHDNEKAMKLANNAYLKVKNDYQWKAIAQNLENHVFKIRRNHQ